MLLSDLVAAIPFTSICLAAASRGIPFVFHNANEWMKFHSYDEHGPRITKSYEDLKRLVMATPERHETNLQDPIEANIAQGFVDFLRDPKGSSTRDELDH